MNKILLLLDPNAPKVPPVVAYFSIVEGTPILMVEQAGQVIGLTTDMLAAFEKGVEALAEGELEATDPNPQICECPVCTIRRKTAN